MHLDGARIWNAIVATGIPAKTWADHFDTISVCFSKGLGAPIGSALCGSRAAIQEARRLNIPVVAVLDSNSDPEGVTFPIPGNDDATKSIAIVVNYIVAAIAEGLAERQAEKVEDDSTGDVEESAEAKAARFEQRADGGDDRNKRSRGAAPGGGAPKRRVPGPGAGGRKPAGGAR